MQLIALLIFAAAVRLPGIFSAPFWSDEYFSWLTATQPTFVQFFLRCVGVDVYPPLSYFPVWIIAKFTDAQWALRLPSAAAGVLCVWAVVRLMRRYVPEKQALALGLLAALTPLSVYLGWEAKAYNFFAFCNLMMLDEALRLIERPKSHARGPLVFWTAASMWSFFLAPYFIAAVLLGLWWGEGRRSAALDAVLKSMGMGMLWALPLAPFFVKTLLLYSGSSAYNTALLQAPLFSLQNFSAGFWFAPERQAVALSAFAAAAAILMIPRRAVDPRPVEGRLLRLLASLAFLPPLLFLAVSALAKPNYNDRAMLVSAFAWVMLAGLGALRLRGLISVLLCSALVLTQATALIDYHKRPEAARVDYGATWRLVRAQWADGDLILHAYFESGLPFKYYISREKKDWPNLTIQEDLGFPSDPTAQGIRGAWRRLNEWLGRHHLGVYAGTDPSFADMGRVKVAASYARRIWLVLPSDEAIRRQMMQIPNGYRGGQDPGRHFDIAKMGWLKGYFKFVSEQGDEDVRVYLYQEIKKNASGL